MSACAEFAERGRRFTRTEGIAGIERKSGQSGRSADADCGAPELAIFASEVLIGRNRRAARDDLFPDTRTERQGVLRRTEAARGTDAIDRGQEVPALGRGRRKLGTDCRPPEPPVARISRLTGPTSARRCFS
jgi:hypothetical protein